MRPIPLLWQSWLYSHVGFAEAARNYLLALNRYYSDKYNIKVISLDKKHSNIDLEEIPEGKKFLKWEKTEIFERPIWITETGPFQILPNYGYSIGLVVWECYDWPERFLIQLRKQDEIWTPAKFTAKALKEKGFKNVHIMPHALDVERFNPDKIKPLPRAENAKNKFRFLCILGWSERKGISALLQAYLEEFDRNEETELYIKMNYYDVTEALKEIKAIKTTVGKGGRSPQILLDTEIYGYKRWPRIYKTANAFVLPSRGEGWGLNYVEAMAMELPTIGTDVCSMPDYMNEDNSYLVSIKGFEIEKRCDWICSDYVGMKFPIINVAHLKERMREVFEHREEAKEKGKRARQDMIRLYRPEIIAKRMNERLIDVWDKTTKFPIPDGVKVTYKGGFV